MIEKTQFQSQRDHELEIVRRRLFADAFLDTLRRSPALDATASAKNAETALKSFDSYFKSK